MMGAHDGSLRGVDSSWHYISPRAEVGDQAREEGVNHRNHRSRWFLPDRVVARKRLRGPWNYSTGLKL